MYGVKPCALAGPCSTDFWIRRYPKNIRTCLLKARKCLHDTHTLVAFVRRKTSQTGSFTSRVKLPTIEIQQPIVIQVLFVCTAARRSDCFHAVPGQRVQKGVAE
jgi:hypothetical protein